MPRRALRSRPSQPTRLALCALVLAAFGVTSTPAAADAAYRWKDAEGRVHFSDRPPPGVNAQQIELQKTPSVQAQPVTPPSAAPADKSSEGTLIGEKAPTKSRSEMSCEERWAEYFKSQECFAPYQRVNAGPREEAYEKCTQVPSPEADCGAPKNFPAE